VALRGRGDGRVFLASRRWSHHAAHSGYDLLARHVGTPVGASAVADALLPDWVVRRAAGGLRGYDRTSLALELQVAWHMARRRNCLYHVLYGDNCYRRLASRVGWRGHRVVVSYHHPPAKLAEWVPDRALLGSASAVIVLGHNHLASFDGVIPDDRLFLVPYAVDTDYFRPPDDASARQPGLCLFVGAHLRDCATLAAVIEDARFRAPGLRFVVVAHDTTRGTFEGVVGNFEVRMGLSEIDLLGLYQTASILVMPLHDAVANTTILEAMACGLPSVVTDVGAVRDYVDDQCAWLVPPYHPDAMLNALIALSAEASADRHREMSQAARRRALGFDWSRMVGHVTAVYDRVFAMPPSPEGSRRGHLPLAVKAG
jgi:glycosyltransferase involved in cell wall biosynthesis